MNLCCPNCFSDEYLKSYLKENGHRGTCDFCCKNSAYCIDPEELADLFLPVIHLYSIVEDFMPTEELKEYDGEFIWEKLNNDWEIFNLDYKEQEELLRSMFPGDRKEGPPQFLESYVERENEYWGTDDDIADELKKRWEDFCNEIKYENRFFIKKQVDLYNLGDLLSYLSISLDNELLYRARNNTRKAIHQFKPQRMGKPSAKQSQHGRANPKGIPYLYLASDAETAIAEIRPGIHDRITVGKFKIINSLKVIDLRNPGIDSPFKHGHELEYIIQHAAFLRKLGSEISKPINPEDPELEYLPLQYLCEFIKHKGFAGVIYKSSVSKGYNVAVFNDNKVRCISTKLYELDFSPRPAKK
ncbi:MAG: hypothetical protein CSYNP_00502 [Syntrophus sp. SKADARSKE-3]|nr:hypothetical protein [Syntrophus sp. SKADARSKE-3]